MVQDAIDKKNHSQQIVFFFIMVVFVAFSIYVAIHLQPNIAPDEHSHFLFSKLYSETWGIPENSAQTIVTGWMTKDTPFFIIG